jgi:hypothetical protein
LAADIEWAAKRLPFPTKCLPRAMALSWMLRRKRIGHAVVIAVRPSQLRQSPDAMHAWIEVESKKVLGDLPGPWIETLRIGGWSSFGRALDYRRVAGCKEIQNQRSVSQAYQYVPKSRSGGRDVTKESTKKKKWIKPELRRIGEVKEIAGPGPIGPQGASAKSWFEQSS